jgi:3-hydroxyacyl-CoA dehydrogenase
METPESKALRHALLAERAAGKVDGITPSTPVRPLDQAAVSERDRRLALLRPTLSYEAIGRADVVIEAVVESMEVKRGVFVALDRVMKAGAVLATNTSTLDVDAIAGFTRRPSDVLGLHVGTLAPR